MMQQISYMINAKSCCLAYLPSAFTPNNDGLNDRFGPNGTHYKVLEFNVFNRLGQMVYSASSNGVSSVSWDGTYNGVVQDPGVFFWELTYSCDQEPIVKTAKGNLTLVR